MSNLALATLPAEADAGFLGRLILRVRRQIRYHQALHELRRLDDRDLDDLDLARADFPMLARRHATGAEPVARLRG